MKMDGLYPAVFSHPANFTSIAWFKASASSPPASRPGNSNEATDIKWVTLEEMKELNPTFEEDIQILESLSNA